MQTLPATGVVGSVGCARFDMNQAEHPDVSTCNVCGLVPAVPTLSGAAEIVAKSPVMQTTLRRVARYARSDAPVLLLGETGTGKEILARLVHASSPRARGPFVPVNVAALPAHLLESELFGHGKGAFTGATQTRRGLFEEAQGGTLFLDEVAELPIALQAKLLRALSDGEIRRVGENRVFPADVRVISATHRPLFELVQRGTFREDLYYRLAVLSVHVPPLRTRREDILPLALRLLRDEGTAAVRFSEEASALLLACSFPGNVRQLHNMVRHGAALAAGETVEAADLPAELSGDPVFRAETRAAPLLSLARVEREHILRVLQACNGVLGEAASILGIGRTTLWRRLRSYGLEK